MTNLDVLCAEPIKLAMALIKTVDAPTFVQGADADFVGYYVPAYKTTDGQVFASFDEALTHQCKWLKEPAEQASKQSIKSQTRAISCA